ncbi:DUF5983 family protein [Methylorubrum sp. SL192]|uniref:DUF5983 family protein n=1 Tax=Methylorubrum sp. SL192 TaxID=2995167 RepID=UPI003FA35857
MPVFLPGLGSVPRAGELRDVAETGPGRPGGAAYDAEDPWHALIVDPHSHGCWIHTGIVGAGMPDGLPASLVAVLRAAHAQDAVWILFDTELEPTTFDLPVFDHSSPRQG